MEIVLKIFLRLISLIPFGIQMFFGMLLGKLLFKYLKKRKAVTIWNIKKCFPNLDEAQVKDIAKQNFIRLGQSIFEICNSYYKSNKEFLKMIKNSDEIEKKIHEIKNQKNLILVPHTGNVDFVVRVPSIFLKLNGMQRAQENKLWNKIMTEGRSKFVDKIFLPNEGKRLLKTLNNGESVLYAPDQDYGYKSSIFVDFFNHKALTVVFPSVLVKRTGCKVYLLTLVKEDNGYVADLEKLDLEGENEEADLKKINIAIESFATSNISEYYWIHRRFKNRPKGEKSFYPEDALRKTWL